MLQLRRNHISVVVGTDLVIHGGIDDTGNILSSWYALWLKTHIWGGLILTVTQRPKLPVVYNQPRKTKIKIDKNSDQYKIENLKSSPLIADETPGEVSHHAACLAVYTSGKGQGRNISLYEKDSQKTPLPSVIQYEGIYVFGGK